ncbi:MAG: 2-hydroxyacyl-CoA dehydratase [Bacillota bacterium]
MQLGQRNKTVGWVCTYTPEELIYAAGFLPTRLMPSDTQSNSGSEDLFPNSLCPFVRQVMNKIRSEAQKLEGIVIANYCNAMMHLYNAINYEFDGFVYLLDVPRKIDQKAKKYFYQELQALLSFLEKHGGSVSDCALKTSIELYNHRTDIFKKLTYGDCIDGNSFPWGQARTRIDSFYELLQQ